MIPAQPRCEARCEVITPRPTYRSWEKFETVSLPPSHFVAVSANDAGAIYPETWSMRYIALAS